MMKFQRWQRPFQSLLSISPAWRWLTAFAWLLLIVVLLLQPSGRPVIGPAAPPGPPDIARELYLTTGHIIGFSVMTLLLWWALVARYPKTQALIAAVAIALSLGGVTELAQTLVIDRSASWFDFLVNSLVTLAVAWGIRRYL
ncbi:MAG: VanZ family protein [bacterium]|nr:VanZ family protein [bacterium]